MTLTDHHRERIRAVLRATVLIAVAAVAVLWFWNITAETLGWPELRFRHAVGFVLAVVVTILAGRAAIGTPRRAE